MGRVAYASLVDPVLTCDWGVEVARWSLLWGTAMGPRRAIQGDV